MSTGGAVDSRGSAGSAGTDESRSKNDTRGPKVHTSFRINQVVELFSQMKGEKEKLLKEVGLHGLTLLPREDPTSNRSFNWQFAYWLLMKVDSETGELDLGLRGRLDMRCEDVGLVLGITCSGQELKKTEPLLMQTTKQKVKNQLLLGGEEELNLENVKRVLEQDIKTDDSATDAKRKAFVTAAFIFAVSYFLAPKGRPPKVNSDILGCLLDLKNVKNINWASYVLMSLREASAKLKREVSANTKSVTLDGCLLLLQVVYLDNLDFGSSSTKHNAVPRVKDFSFQLLDQLINADKHQRGRTSAAQFGARKLRADQDTSYTRGGLLKAILLSKERIESGAFMPRDKEQMLAYLRKNVEEGKRKIRLATRQFEEQACESMDEYQQHVTTVLDICITGGIQSLNCNRGNDTKGQDGYHISLYEAAKTIKTQQIQVKGNVSWSGSTNQENTSPVRPIKKRSVCNRVSQGRAKVNKLACVEEASTTACSGGGAVPSDIVN